MSTKADRVKEDIKVAFRIKYFQVSYRIAWNSCFNNVLERLKGKVDRDFICVKLHFLQLFSLDSSGLLFLVFDHFDLYI